MSVPAGIYMIAFAVIVPATRRRPSMDYLGFCSAAKAFRVVPKRRDASVTTKLGGDEMSLIG